VGPVIARLLRRGRRSGEPDDNRIAALEARLDQLESIVESLQDALHREAIRRDEDTNQIQRRIEPRAIAKALSDDARRRGL
jgi:hypothetical protein